MRRRQVLDVGLIGASVFSAVALVAAATMGGDNPARTSLSSETAASSAATVDTNSAAAAAPAAVAPQAAPRSAARPTAATPARPQAPGPKPAPAAPPARPAPGAGPAMAGGVHDHSGGRGTEQAHMADGHSHGGGKDVPLDGWTVPADSYATPDHPAYDWYAKRGIDSADDPGASLRDKFVWDEQFGCNVDHPYMRWLLDETTKVVEANYLTLRDALVGGFIPLSVVIPNDFGYPDTYWHWWNQLHTRPRWQDRVISGAEPKNERDWVVQPEDLQHLLMVPTYWRGEVTSAFEAVVGDEVDNEQTQGEMTDGWVTAGVMFAQEYPEPLTFYDGCTPMHNHGFGDNPHMHMWLYHHLHPLAMNPPHLCNADGSPKEAPYGPLDATRDHTTWTCIHGDEHGPGEDAGEGGGGATPIPTQIPQQSTAAPREKRGPTGIRPVDEVLQRIL